MPKDTGRPSQWFLTLCMPSTTLQYTQTEQTTQWESSLFPTTYNWGDYMILGEGMGMRPIFAT